MVRYCKAMTFSSIRENLNYDSSLPQIRHIAFLISESMNGAFLIILEEPLPFHMSVEKYAEFSRKYLLNDAFFHEVSPSVSINLGNIKAAKITTTTIDGEITQIIFIKDSIAYALSYNLGFSE